MAKYRNKKIIEAFQFDGDFMNSKGEYYVPEWAVRGLKRGILYFEGPELYLKQGYVSRHIHYGDYIIRDHRGIIDSFGRETFEKWYEKIGE